MQPLLTSRHATHDERELQKAWKVLAEHMHVDVHATTQDRDATRRFLIVPQHEMENHVLLILDGRTREITHTYPLPDPNPVNSWQRVLSAIHDLPEKLSKRASELSEERIRLLVDFMIDFDPFKPVESRIDARNAELRTEFLNDFRVLDSAAVHKRAGLKGTNRSQTVNAWRTQGRILGLQIQGKYGYPEFQLDADGRPLKLMKATLDALPAHFTAWQRAFWLVSPKEGLDGKTPATAIRTGDDRVVDVAKSADQLPVGQRRNAAE